MSSKPVEGRSERNSAPRRRKLGATANMAAAKMPTRSERIVRPSAHTATTVPTESTTERRRKPSGDSLKGRTARASTDWPMPRWSSQPVSGVPSSQARAFSA